MRRIAIPHGRLSITGPVRISDEFVSRVEYTIHHDAFSIAPIYPRRSATLHLVFGVSRGDYIRGIAATLDKVVRGILGRKSKTYLEGTNLRCLEPLSAEQQRTILGYEIPFAKTKYYHSLPDNLDNEATNTAYDLIKAASTHFGDSVFYEGLAQLI